MAEETRARRRFMQIGFVILGVASLVALIAMIATGIEKVHTGHGLDTSRTWWLVEFNWVGFLVLVAAVLVALVGGGILRYIEWRELRQLRQRYSGGGNDV
jgi:uncharacterized membrane protein